MIELAQLMNQPINLKVGFFIVKIMPLSVNNFYSIAPANLPPLEILLRSIVTKDELSWVMLKDFVDPERTWTHSVLYCSLRNTYKLPHFVLVLLIAAICKQYSHAYLFKVLAEQNGLISYFDLCYANNDAKPLSQKEVLESYCLNFSLIYKLFGNQINDKLLELNNIYDVLNYPQFHFFIASDLLTKGLAQHNAQLMLEEKDLKKEFSYIESQHKKFTSLMRACFGDLPKERYFDADIEKRFKAGMGKYNIKLYDLFKKVTQ